MPLRVGIVGCGTAGPAAAAMLACRGCSVTVFDKAPVLNPVGAGLLLQPSGLAVLAEMGLADAVGRAGSIVRRMHATAPPASSGRTILDLSYADLRPDLFGVGIRRGELLRLLLRTARDAGAVVRTGIEVAAIRDRATESELVDVAGTSLGAFDLVLVCDGARSSLVASLGTPARVRPYRWGALWFIGSRPVDESAPHHGVLEQVYLSTTGLIGSLPSGRLDDGNEAVSIFFSARTDRFESIRQGSLDDWRRSVAALHPRAGEIARQVGGPAQLLPAAYREVVLPQWHRGRVAVLGDAGHALSPLLGMGANMSLVDARTLAQAVSAHGVYDGLAAYSSERGGSIRAYQRICRWMNPFFQSDLPPLALARDVMMPRLCRWRWSRRQALLTVAGVKTGLLAADPLP
ncbi:MAG TPA: NAD(P)/FAD-dependent oxidoreductase, partial [Phycisphaerales bacterium]|nr:NAD(P)/FAD-dependent oxidoreductase [Phycisphaerales bacterium]